jgi:hypothetical protein
MPPQPAAPGPELPPPPPPKGGAPSAPQGKLVISAPPVPPPMQRAGYHVHDGFYLRLSAGVGAGHTSVSGPQNFGVGGAGLALNLWAGGTPWRGTAIGGLLSYQGLNEGDTVVEGSGTGAGANGHIVLVGPFIDVFPDPLRGLHFGGSAALAFVGTQADSHLLEDKYAVKDYSGGGLGGSIWLGYMGFVGQEYSMGGILQLSGFASNKKDDDGDRKANGYSVSLSFSALYH